MRGEAEVKATLSGSKREGEGQVKVGPFLFKKVGRERGDPSFLPKGMGKGEAFLAPWDSQR